MDFTVEYQTTETVEYFDPEELEAEDETLLSDHQYVVHNTKFLNGMFFGSGGQGGTLSQSSAKELFETSKKLMAEFLLEKVIIRALTIRR